MPSTVVHIFNETANMPKVGKDVSLYFVRESYVLITYASIFIGYALHISHRNPNVYLDPSYAYH